MYHEVMKQYAFLLICLFALACSQKSDYSLRILHASPDSDDFRLLVDGETFSNALAYGQATSYKNVDKDILDFEGFDEDTIKLFTISHTFTSTGRHTLAIADHAGSLDFIVIEDEKVDLESGRTALRFWNGIPASHNYDIYVTNPGINLSQTSLDFSNFDYATASTYLKADAGSYQIRITEPGGTEPEDIVFNETLTFSADKSYTLAFLEAEGSGEPYQLVQIKDE